MLAVISNFESNVRPYDTVSKNRTAPHMPTRVIGITYPKSACAQAYLVLRGAYLFWRRGYKLSCHLQAPPPALMVNSDVDPAADAAEGR